MQLMGGSVQSSKVGQLLIGGNKSISEQAAEENMKHNVLISTVRYDASTWDDPVIKASPFAKTVRREGIWL